MTTFSDDFKNLTDVQWRKSVEATNGLFVAEGVLAITRAYELGYKPRSVMTTDHWISGLPAGLLQTAAVEVIDSIEMQDVTGYHVHRGALASFDRPDPLEIKDLLGRCKTIVVLENIVDHENVGAIMRSAAGMNVDAILLSNTCADPLYRRSIKVSQGESLAVPYARFSTIEECLEILNGFGFESWALTPAASTDLLSAIRESVTDSKVALWLGTEGDGLTEAALAGCTQQVSIPMSRQTDSLNVATAGAIAIWALSQRGKLSSSQKVR